MNPLDVAKKIIKNQQDEIEWHKMYEKYLVGQIDLEQMNSVNTFMRSYEELNDKELIAIIRVVFQLTENDCMTSDEISRLINVHQDRIEYIFSRYSK